MDARAGEVHQEAVTAGDAYVLVWPGEGGPALHPQAADVMHVKHDEDEPHRIVWAVKLWRRPDSFIRANVYFPDRLEKFITGRAMSALPGSYRSFFPYADEGEPWPLANPLGEVPIVHFANNARLGDVGKSELVDTIPLQDALNKAVADMLVAMEFHAFLQRWATGVQVQYDESGKPVVPFEAGSDRIWVTPAADAKFGQFDPAGLQQFIAVQESFRAEVARVSGTPLHYLLLQTGDFPSGEAMRTAESRFLSKIRKRLTAFGNRWEDVMRLALKADGRADVRLNARWTDPAPVSEKERLEALEAKKRLGIPDEQLWSEMGYGQADIERMAAMRDAAGAAASFLDKLNAGP